MTGARTPSAIVPKEEQAGVDRMSQDGTPAEGRDLGAAAGLNDTDRAGKAQMARDDQPRTTGDRQQRKQLPEYQPKGHDGVPRHQQHKQRTAPPRAAPERLGAAASTGDMARTEKVQAITAAQRKQERCRLRRPPRAALTQKLPSPALKEAERFVILQSGRFEHPYGGNCTAGTVQGHQAGRATRAALNLSTPT